MWRVRYPRPDPLRICRSRWPPGRYRPERISLCRPRARAHRSASSRSSITRPSGPGDLPPWAARWSMAHLRLRESVARGNRLRQSSWRCFRVPQRPRRTRSRGGAGDPGTSPGGRPRIPGGHEPRRHIVGLAADGGCRTSVPPVADRGPDGRRAHPGGRPASSECEDTRPPASWVFGARPRSRFELLGGARAGPPSKRGRPGTSEASRFSANAAIHPPNSIFWTASEVAFRVSRRGGPGRAPPSPSSGDSGGRRLRGPRGWYDGRTERHSAVGAGLESGDRSPSSVEFRRGMVMRRRNTGRFGENRPSRGLPPFSRPSTPAPDRGRRREQRAGAGPDGSPTPAFVARLPGPGRPIGRRRAVRQVDQEDLPRAGGRSSRREAGEIGCVAAAIGADQDVDVRHAEAPGVESGHDGRPGGRGRRGRRPVRAQVPARQPGGQLATVLGRFDEHGHPRPARDRRGVAQRRKPSEVALGRGPGQLGDEIVAGVGVPDRPPLASSASEPPATAPPAHSAHATVTRARWPPGPGTSWMMSPRIASSSSGFSGRDGLVPTKP